MERSLELLRRISKIINMDLFYAINVYRDKIILQGYYSPSAVKALYKTGIAFGIEYSNGYIESRRCISDISLNIVLTD